MENYQNINSINVEKQKKLNTIKKINASLDTTEKALKEKIEFRYRELESLKKEYNNIVEAYGHIIRSFVKQ